MKTILRELDIQWQVFRMFLRNLREGGIRNVGRSLYLWLFFAVYFSGSN